MKMLDITYRLTLFLVLYTTPCLPADASAENWDSRMAEGAALSKDGKHSEAVACYQSAVLIAEHFPTGDRRLLNSLDALAAAYAEAGQYAQSAHQYRRGLEFLEKSGRRDSIDYALLLGGLASTDPSGIDTPATIQMLRKAIELNTGSPEEVNSLRDYLCQIYENRGQAREAESVLLEQQAYFKSRKEIDSLGQAALLNNLGTLRFNAKRYEDARTLYAESLRIYEANCGSGNSALIGPLNNLGSSLVAEKRFKDADAIFQRAISLCRETLGMSHPTCGVTLIDYAVCLRGLGRRKQARALKAEARRILRSAGRQNGVGLTIGVESLRFVGR